MHSLLWLSLIFSMSDFDIGFGQPIPADVWAIKQDPERGIYDAVIVESLTEIKNVRIKHHRKIRILNENGKEAAELVDRSGKARNLKGRVVDISGRETTFDRKDFVAVFLAKTQDGRKKAKILVPPGLTANCFVEMTWTVPATDGIPRGSYSSTLFVQEPYFCQKKVFRILDSATQGASSLVTRFVWANGGVKRYLKKKVIKGNTILSSTDISPFSVHPFGSLFLDKNAAYLQIFKTIPDFGTKPEEFYRRFGTDYVKAGLFGDRFKRPPEYKTWIKQLKAGLPEDHVKAMTMVYNAFRKRIAISDLLPPEKKAAITKDFEGDENPDRVLAMVFKRGYGPPRQLGMLFYHVARDCDLPFQLLFTNSIYGQHFRPGALNPYALNLSYPLFGLELGRHQWMVFAPQWQENSAGYFPSAYQGVPALAIDPYDKWTFQFTTTPRFNEDAHRRIRQYDMSVDKQGGTRFSLTEQAAGQFNANMRSRYYVLPQKERDEMLLETWQNRLGDWDVETAEVENAENFKDTINLKVTASTDYDPDGDNWMAIDPFPGSQLPLSNPSIWPKDRTQPIILPRCLKQIDFARIALPANWKVKGSPSWKRLNEVGEVSMVAVQEGNQLTVRRDIVVKRDILTADKERDLKFFIAWMNESNNQTIAVTMGGQL